MPIAAFACPPDKPTHGETHDIEHCVTECSTQCYSPFLMAAIYGVNIRNHHKGRYVSATALSGCKRRLQLERTVPYAEYFSGLYAAFRGTITHTVIEEAMATKFPSGRSLESLGFVAEWQMLVGFCLTEGHGAFSVPAGLDVDDLATYAQHSCPECDGEGIAPKDQNWILLGGTLDGAAPIFNESDEEDGPNTIFIDEEGTAHYKLSDIKTMKEYALTYFIKGDAKNKLHPQIKDDYVRQARVYSYLASRAAVPEALKKLGVKRIKMVRSDIQAFAMGEAPWTGGGTFRWKDHWRNPLKDWPMFPIDLGTDAWVEAYILREAEPILNSLILGKERGAVRKDDNAWLCTYCAFQGTEFCPNPEEEAKLLRMDGVTPEQAFKAASKNPMTPPVQRVEALTEKDTSAVDSFFKWQRGEIAEEVPVEERVEKAKAKKKAAPKSDTKPVVDEAPAPKQKRAPRKKVA